MKLTTLAQCMDIFDWFDDPYYEYIHHILLSKSNAGERIARALQSIIDHATKLLDAHRSTEDAYPEELANQPA